MPTRNSWQQTMHHPHPPPGPPGPPFPPPPAWYQPGFAPAPFNPGGGKGRGGGGGGGKGGGKGKGGGGGGKGNGRGRGRGHGSQETQAFYNASFVENPWRELLPNEPPTLSLAPTPMEQSRDGELAACGGGHLRLVTSAK